MLDAQVLVVETTVGMVPATLPEALACLCDATLVGFDGLAAHQRHGWDLFLFQIAAMALQRSGEAGAADDDMAWRGLDNASAWRQRLAAITPDCADTAWSLVVDDLTKPAFLQPPIPTGTLAGFAVAGRTPDEIDVLVTSRGHDVKAARAVAAAPRHWLFALCTLQTQQGYSGRGLYGIARMNGGHASRPLVELTPARDLPSRFRRGVQAALAARAAALDIQDGYYDARGLPLLWLEPWDQEASLPLAGLDPLFVEVCRRIRLVRDNAGEIAAWGRPSKTVRVALPKEAKGVTGDAWTPVNVAEQAALTVGAAGFDYRLVNRLIASAEFERPTAMRPRPGDRGGLWLHAAVLVRGQCETEGLHERWLLIPAKARRGMSEAGAAESIDRLGASMVADADAAKRALRCGLQCFLQGAPDKINFKDGRPQPWLDALDQGIDRVFFGYLFARAADESDTAAEAGALAWRDALVRLTRRMFTTAIERLDPPLCRRERAAAVASLTFDGMLRRAALTRPVAAEPTQTTELGG